jgi:hypothetical protein
MPNLPSLVIEYKIPRNQDSVYLKARHALEEVLDALLRKHKLGECDGGSIGSGTMEVFCDVKDYAKARALVVKAIKSTPYADFERMYKVAAQKPEPKAKGKAYWFRKGDCLALREGRKWGAAYVIAVDPDGQHVVVTLNYLDKAKPELVQFRRMKALVLTHHDWEKMVDVSIEARPSKKVRARVEVVGNSPLKFSNVDVVKFRGDWVNWKQTPDRVTRSIDRDLGPRDRDPASGRYVMYSGGEWLLLDQVKRQRAWDAKRSKK